MRFGIFVTSKHAGNPYIDCCMKSEVIIEAAVNQRKDLRIHCPFCLSSIDVNLDKRDRPYWVCISCQTRTFATRTTLDCFTESGWIWSDKPSREALRMWLDRVAITAGLKKKRRK